MSGAYKLGDRTVLKGGWGLFYDTLNAADFSPNQTGYDVTTTSTISTDFGQTWIFGNPRAATIASCITCSWKIGTPSVRSSTAFTASLG